MSSQDSRLRRADFLRRPLRSLRFRYGSIKIIPGIPGGGSVISRKTLRLSVHRNRLRRRLAAILRVLKKEGMLTERIILYPNAGALKTPSRDLQEAISNALR